MTERTFMDELLHRLAEAQKDTAKKHQPLTDGFANAIDDIRTKLVEEGWYGRAVAPEVEVKETLKVLSVAEMQAMMGHRERDPNRELEQERSRGQSR